MYEPYYLKPFCEYPTTTTPPNPKVLIYVCDPFALMCVTIKPIWILLAIDGLRFNPIVSF